MNLWIEAWQSVFLFARHAGTTIFWRQLQPFSNDSATAVAGRDATP
jgi:hypothetical protein